MPRYINFLPILLIASLAITSCGSSRKAKNRIVLDELTVIAGDNAYRASAPRTWDITHTGVTLSFNFMDRTANGYAMLRLHPYFYNSDKIVLDAKSMRFDSVKADGKKARCNYHNDSLTIYLDRKYHRDEYIKLELWYLAMPYATNSGGSKAINEDRGLYFINPGNTIPHKPVQVWTQGETEANSHWVPTIDKPNERFVTELKLVVPDSFTTLSNGELMTSIKGENGMRTDIWRMDKPIQPYVMMFAIGQFTIVADEPWNGIPVNYYVEPEYAPYAKEMFQHTPEMIDFFSKLTGVPYPWNKYSQVVVRDYVSGAMENTTATVFGEFINQTSREMLDVTYEDVVSHELFHQWFGDYVTTESWSNITLNESFATYGEQLWKRYKYGTIEEQALAYKDLQAYLDQAKTNDDPLVRFFYKNKEDLFDRISYQKGGYILRYLHGLMGDSAFYRAMNIYLQKNALQPAEAHQWRLAVEEATGLDWNWFFNQWYFRGGHPVTDIKYAYDDDKKEVTVTFEQKQEQVYKLPMQLAVVSGGQKEIHDIEFDTRLMTLKLPYPAAARPVVLPDIQHWIPGVLNEHKTGEEWLAHYKAAGTGNYLSRLYALKATAKDLNQASVQDMYNLALEDTIPHLREAALNYIYTATNAGLKKQFGKTTQTIAGTDPANAVRAAAINLLGKWEIAEAKDIMYRSLYDSSYAVAGAALTALGQVAKDTVYTLAKTLAETEPGGALQNAVWVVIGNKGNAVDTTYWKHNLYHVSGKNNISFADGLSLYAIHTDSDSAFTMSLDMLQYLVKSESIKSYRLVMVSYIFDAAFYYKGKLGDANTSIEADKAKFRLNNLVKLINALEKEETDEENLSNYRTYKKQLLSIK